MKTFTRAWHEARQQQIATGAAPDDGKFIWKDKIYTTHTDLADDNKSTSSMLVPAQSFFLKEELFIATALEQIIPALREEFLANTPGFADGDLKENQDLMSPLFATARSKAKNNNLVDTIKYVFPPHVDMFYKNKKNVYPTIVDYVKNLGDNCSACNYIVLTPSVMDRVSAIENEENKFVRIYVPLVIPEDNFLEVEGIEISYADIFAIDSTLAHSEHNLGSTPRLALTLDISREYLGLPPGNPYDLYRQRALKPFVRGAEAKMYHTVER
jgi:hypothetical protein